MKKIFNKKNIVIFLAIVGALTIFYFVFGSMHKTINETYFYVVFNTNGGSRIPVQKVKINEVATLPEEPTKKGYKFKYWALDNKEYSFNTKVRNNITLFAIWESEVNQTNEENTSEESQGSEE